MRGSNIDNIDMYKAWPQIGCAFKKVVVDRGGGETRAGRL